MKNSMAVRETYYAKSISILVTCFIFGCSSGSKNESSGIQDSGSTATLGSQTSGSSSGAAAPVSQREQRRAQQNEREQLLRSLAEASDRQDLDQMAKFSSDILLRNPNQIEALHAMGVVHFRRGQNRAAEYFWSLALKQDAQFAPSLNNMALVYLQKSDFRQAMSSLRSALGRSYPRVAANLGAYFAEARDYAKAQVALGDAIQRGYRDAKTFNNLGLSQMATGRIREAGISFQEAVKLEPNNAEILFNQAIFFIDHQKDQAQGLAVVERIRFLGVPVDMRSELISLENRAKSNLR